MNFRFLLITLFLGFRFFATSQEDAGENIVENMDDLTVKWDHTAKRLMSRVGFTDYCGDSASREHVLYLLDKIHQCDSVLYSIILSKYETRLDLEAGATLDAIEKLEMDYATEAFTQVLHRSCVAYNDAERNMTSGTYKQEVRAIEKELKRYVDAITKQIHSIDKQIRHLRRIYKE